MAYRGLIPGRFPEKDLKRSRVMEIAPDIWNIEGYVSTSFFFKPPSSNCFILRDKDLVLLIDTGTYPHYRKKILSILERYRQEGAKRLILMLTQGHFDHVANNDIILEAGYPDTRFLLPEVEVSTLDLYNHWTGEYQQLKEYYDPYRELPKVFPTIVVNMLSRVSESAAERLIKKNIASLFHGVKTMAHAAEILPNSSRVRKKFGDIEFYGWEVGRFFAIHDATHSPGHLSFYDPKYKIFLTGDATLEINPPFFNSSLNNCIDMMKRFKRFAELGYVETATDAHRSSIWAAMLMEKLKTDPLNTLQTLDKIEGKDNCAAFYRFFEEYYSGMKTEVLRILSRLHEATIHELLEEFKASRDPYARFKVAQQFPKLPSRVDVMIANIMKENSIPRRREGKRIIFSSP